MFRNRRCAVLYALIAVFSLGLLSACGGDDAGADGPPNGTSSPQSRLTPGEGDQVEDTQDDTASESDAAELRTATAATLFTNLGEITVTLFGEQAPITVDNFLGLADGSKAWAGQQNDEPLYQGVIFHRVIDGFMIQGGDPEGTGRGGPGYQFEDEIDPSLTFDRPYLLAMANAGPGTNGSQFFITVTATPHLNGLHTIFGEVADADSRAVVDAIAAVETDQMDKPLEDVVITSILADD
jgi:peptidyl-prolyl cis-trans isomerase A (cyclophilin A)